ncbi:putative RING-H2 zinc finger protein RHA2a [Cinnamomum micranthum f. kanehirae]|uniref:Putative RING-H2 zinc finger protein RHA2a n=1 Tax=Cinnamomum micranthum f. kanehirae TaxID=337451 RepID=A0A3S3NZ06_9MAGN|nr:putative RING-H2 zinc finger protein RHA2a [Cinnamomum micranthum f. kanehirae]
MSPSPPYLLTISSPLPDLLIASFSLLLIISSKPHHHLKIPPVHLPFIHHNSRRLLILKNPNRNPNPNPNIIMSKTPSTSTSQFLDLSSPQSLSDWLAPRLPSDAFSSWGSKPGTKNVHNLWLELSQGETSLADSTPPIRTVNVATIRIRSSSRRILLESHQELSDGSVRTRLRPLSEKMKPGESVEAAVQRAVKEELGSALPAGGGGVRIVPGSYERRVEERLSVSYPGLPACYVLHSVDAWVEGLPDGEFCTEEEDEYEGCGEAARAAEKAVSVRRHFWKWVDEEALQHS